MRVGRAILCTGIAAALIALLLFTRFGVFIVFDVLGDLTGSDDLDTEPAAGPLVLDRMLYHTDAITLPGELEQPSGIDITAMQIFVSTDQAELFELSRSGRLENQTDLLGGPLLLKQGTLESIVFVQDDEPEVWGIGELGVLARWRWTRAGWTRIDDLPLPAGLQASEFTGLTRLDGVLYATTETLGVVNLSTGEMLEVRLGDRLKPGRAASEVMLSGLAHDGSLLYLVTENHASLIAVEPETGEVVEIIGIDAGEASDVVMQGGVAYVTVDHNLFDARPPLFVYEIGE